MGASGSGKSTLLHCLAGILSPTSGEVWFEGERIDRLSDARRSRLRLQRMGVVFQFGDFVPELTVEENVMLPLLLAGGRRTTSVVLAGNDPRSVIGVIRPRSWLVVATHDHHVAAHLDRLVYMRDGIAVDQPMAMR